MSVCSSPKCKLLFYFLWNHTAYSGYFENRKPLKPVPGVCVCVCVGGWGYAVSQTTLLHMNNASTYFTVVQIIFLFPIGSLSPFWVLCK